MSTAHDAHSDDHGHGHHGSPFVQHHYDDAQHQFDSGKLGIWLFLAQEVLFFSALFVAYVLYRVHHGEIYDYAHKYLDVKYGAINTAVLIFSSLTAAWAVRCAQLNQKRGLIACLTLTLLCALTFLGIKYVEYTHKHHEQLLFGRYFDPCVSPGHNELMTKSNDCPGSKTTIKWDYGAKAAVEGCFEGGTLDQDLQRRDLQLDCNVDEVKLEFYQPPIFKASANHDCTKTPFASIDGNGGSYTFSGPCDTIVVKGSGNKVTLDTAKKITVQGADNTVTANAADAIELGATDIKKPDAKPNTVTATKGVTGDKATVTELTDNASVEQGEKSREIARKPITEQCPAPKYGEHITKFPCWKPSYQPAVCPDLTSAAQRAQGVAGRPQVGILVAYGDHEHRDRTTAIRSVCKPAPKPADPGDLLADREQRIEPGKKMIDPKHAPAADDHNALYMGPPPEHTSMFFTIYFAMTGLHGIHVLMGVFVFIWLLIRSIKGHFTPDYFGPIDYAALYWHIVDLIWIFLFPLLYLIV